ncbi:LOW QUALITY PROTEIN: pleckstrin homology domain-containing family G member 5 [Melanotaenia boesemani]|uniref:LOW QUALITY PROTEIN: pleckstrin homology domain-containing family G member 5 n=1 Tax=Melanotaenia boesemani TaxID=1250792 RepID=UPI001C043411|nr:LOW QUALITY PROTEIN: pleckstrin homology domain-containing family G member 5 [Melanotaenia boesemani]
MVPNKWTMSSVLHKSPPRSWLGLRLRLNDKPVQEEDWVVCQHPECPDRRRASKVCHHPDCQDLNSKSPLHLCESCDSRCHSENTDNMHFDRHPRFNLQPQASILARNVSTRSCPPLTSAPPHLEEGNEGSNDHGECKTVGMKLGKKGRRRHTDNPMEYFSLKFDLSVDINTEIVPAMKKKTLREVLDPVFERIGIELSRVDLFLDQSNTPLFLHFEAYRFGGHYLKVKARPGDELKVEQGVKDMRSLSLPNMKPSGGQSPYILTPGNEKVAHESLGRRESIDLLGQARRRKNMTEFLGETNIPTPDSLGQLGGSLPSVGAGSDSWKNRISIFFNPTPGPGAFGKEVDRLEQLQSKLHSYNLFGPPKVPRELSFHQDSWEGEETNLVLEDTWQMLMDDSEMLTKKRSQQQEAIWELLHTEATYIKKLRVITDLFLSGLLNLQESGLLKEVEPFKLFSNIQEIVCLHTSLWNQVMLPVLDKARKARATLDPTHLHDGFMTFGSRFQPYIHYCMEEEGSMEYMRTLLRDNELFRTYVAWAETNKQCNRLKLADMLAKPHQRLTKYPLLLKSILKRTDEPVAREIVSSMLSSVEGFINSVDSQMRQRQERQKLATISARIDSYEAVEGSSEEVEKILKDYSRFDLMAPMRGTSPEETRQLHLEGALRMKEGKDSRMEVYCFLFTDLLLITKPVKRVEKVKIIRQPLLIHNVICKELKDPGSFILIYLNEFKRCSACAVCICSMSNSASQGRSWVCVCNPCERSETSLQRLRSEEDLRQLDIQMRPIEPEEEDESSNSTTSSPVLQRNKELNSSQSDGSTETLSVMDADEPVKHQQPSTSNTNLEESAVQERCKFQLPTLIVHPVDLELNQQVGLDAEELDLQRRSLSMDSAYGTLSPESSLRELQPQPRQSEEEEEEETEEEEFDQEGQEEELVEEETEEVEEDEEEEEEEEEEDASLGSQLSVVQLSKPRRRPHVRSRLNCLQRLSTLTLSRSEDNLLQRVHEKNPVAHETHSLPSETQESQSGDTDTSSSLAHSKSLSELHQDGMELYSSDLNQSEDSLSMSAPADRLRADLNKAGAWHCHTAPPTPREGNEFLSSDSDGVTLPLGCLEKKSKSVEPTPKKRKTPTQQHKKLTVAQLYRIRTTLVLNSTLTASEV